MSAARQPAARPPLPRWRVLLLAPASGALLTLSLAPFKLWPAAIAGCAVYAYLLALCSPRQALWRGWLFGAGLFGSGASWVYVSIHLHGNAAVPLALFLTLLFCAGLALLHAFQAWVLRQIHPPASRRHAAGLCRDLGAG